MTTKPDDEHTRKLRFIPMHAGVTANRSPMANYLTDSEYEERIRPPTEEEKAARIAEYDRCTKVCSQCGNEYWDPSEED